jgi:hypothetical protein
MPTLTQKYRKSPQIVSREIAGEVILVPFSQKAGEIRSSLYTLNETAALAWKMIEAAPGAEPSVEEISRAISAEFEIDQETASQDLLELFAQLEEVGAVLPVSPAPVKGV